MRGIYSLGDCIRDELGDLECLFLGEVVSGYKVRESVYNWGVAIVGYYIYCENIGILVVFY
jgi:hypothetical protein